MGTKFNEMNYQTGMAKIEGTIMWYIEEGREVHYSLGQSMLIYGDFLRRNYEDPVCKSNLNFTLFTPVNGATLVKVVPCIPPQVPEVQDSASTPMSNGFDSPMPSDSPPMEFSEFKNEMMGKFKEVNGSLVFGGDWFWLAGCMAYDNLANFVSIPNFFTSEAPSTTPTFCGCLFSLYPTGLPVSREFPVDDIKECYVESLFARWVTEQETLANEPRGNDMDEEYVKDPDFEKDSFEDTVKKGVAYAYEASNKNNIMIG